MQGITQFAGTPQFTLQQVIDKRYQVLEVLGRRQWERTYLAIDTQSPQRSRCVVKEFCLHHNSPQTLQVVKARFEYEKNWLTALGGYSQVAQLLNLVVTEHAVYSVREFIAGSPVIVETSVGDRWTETQVADLLNDVLPVLQFVHSKAGIHGNLHPGNLIRRESDGRFVLTDVCAISPIGLLLAEVQIAEVMPGKLDRLGYFATEQLWQYPRPNSDLFSLGMICIELLTGQRPWDLPRDLNTGHLLWRRSDPQRSPLVEALLYMTQDHYGDRAQSAHDALTVLQARPPAQQFIAKIRQKRQAKARTHRAKANSSTVTSISPVPMPNPDRPLPAPAPLTAASESQPAMAHNLNTIRSPQPTLRSPENWKILYVAGSVALAMAGVAVGGTLSVSPASTLLLLDSAPRTLKQAAGYYQQGDIDRAIALAAAIPSSSPSFSMAQTLTHQWQQEWERSVQRFSELETAYQNQQWLRVLRTGQEIPETEFWHAQKAPFLHEAQQHVDRQGHEALQAAFDLAYRYQFTEALDALRRIPPEAAAYAQVPAKFAEYEEKQDIRAQYYLQQAYDEAQTGNFMQAIAYLQHITPSTPAYAIAQRKQLEYAEKLHLRTRTVRPSQP